LVIDRFSFRKRLVKVAAGRRQRSVAALYFPLSISTQECAELA
jgi:hypothetical protein